MVNLLLIPAAPNGAAAIRRCTTILAEGCCGDRDFHQEIRNRVGRNRRRGEPRWLRDRAKTVLDRRKDLVRYGYRR
jgi:hypothetical protein